MVEKFNNEFNTNFKISKLRSIARRNSLDKKEKHKSRNFSKEMDDFLKETLHIKYYKELCEKFNKKFGTDYSVIALQNRFCLLRKKGEVKTRSDYNIEDIKKFIIKSAKTKHKYLVVNEATEKFNRSKTFILNLMNTLDIKYVPHIKSVGLPQEIIDFIGTELDKNDREVAKDILEKFNYKMTPRKVSKHRKNHFGKKEFKVYASGKVVSNYEDGCEKFDKNKKITMIKINGNWHEKKRYVYEQTNNIKLKQNQYIINLDGDPFNCEISNLKCVTKQTHLNLLSNGMEGYGNITDVAIKVIETEQLTKKVFNK